MSVRHRITVCLLVSLFACSNKKEVERAKHSLYDADFAVVYSAALEATRNLYPNLDDNPGAGAVKTAWHQVAYANNTDDLSNTRTLTTGSTSNTLAASQGQASAGMPTRLAYKRYFIRFDVSVVGGRPWRVKVVGHAAEWEPGAALPMELHGAARPPWLEGRTDALTLAIYKKIKSHAVPMREDVSDEPKQDELPRTDPKSFTGVPPVAAKRLALLKDAVAHRDYTQLRAQVFDDVMWSLGGAPGADTALAMWQADPETLDEMAKAIEAGCGVPSGQAARVQCPTSPPAAGKWQLVLEHRGADWKVSSFVRNE